MSYSTENHNLVFKDSTLNKYDLKFAPKGYNSGSEYPRVRCSDPSKHFDADELKRMKSLHPNFKNKVYHVMKEDDTESDDDCEARKNYFASLNTDSSIFDDSSTFGGLLSSDQFLDEWPTELDLFTAANPNEPQIAADNSDTEILEQNPVLEPETILVELTVLEDEPNPNMFTPMPIIPIFIPEFGLPINDDLDELAFSYQPNYGQQQRQSSSINDERSSLLTNVETYGDCENQEPTVEDSEIICVSDDDSEIICVSDDDSENMCVSNDDPEIICISDDDS